MQSMTPDVNNAIMRARYLMEQGVMQGDYRLYLHGRSAMNGVLAIEFKEITIPQSQFDKIVQIKNYFICPQCKEQTETIKPHIERIYLKPYLAKIVNRSFDEFITCSNCQAKFELNSESKQNIVIDKPDIFEQQYFPEPPDMSTIGKRSIHATAFWKWVDMNKAFLEDKCRRYREKYSTTNQSLEGIETDEIEPQLETV